MNQNVSQQVSQIMGKEVSRKEFLGMSGLAVASLFGFGTAIKLFTGKSITGNQNAGRGYGASAYGK